MLTHIIFFVQALLINADYSESQRNQASQIHLSLGTENEVIVTWSTRSTASSEVKYGLSEFFPSSYSINSGIESKFVDNGTLHHTQYIHRTSLSPLKELSEYTYQVWDEKEWSEPFSFISPGGASWKPKVTIYGDFGLKNPQAYPPLLEQVKEHVTDFILHNGDFAYNLDDDNATFGDIWLSFVEPIYASIPVMTSVGNHEGMYNYLNYRSRFSMPNYEKTQNLYFSFNTGNAHWISYSTEFYFVYDALEGHGGVGRNFGPYPELAIAQLAFIEEDLIRANKNRGNQPWIFAYGHRPMYCSDTDDSDCTEPNNSWKNEGIEELFMKYGVDIIFESHQHSYERLWPTYNNTVYNSTIPGEPYNNPLAPTHIITGAAGCDEYLDVFSDVGLGPWSAIRISDYGYGNLEILNDTHLTWKQMNIKREVVDAILVTRNEHKGYDL